MSVVLENSAGAEHAARRSIRRWAWITSVCGVFLFGSAQAQAATATANLTVQMTITNGCTIAAATLDFGSSTGTALVAAAVTGSTTVSVTCTSGSPYTVGMGQGSNYLTSSNRMANGANYIPYGLFLDAAWTQPWSTGATNSTCTTINGCSIGTGTGAAQSINIYGKVPIIATAPAAGSYSDTVLMTITY